VPTLLDDPSGHALDRFHAALRLSSRGTGRTRVLVYGGSHAASDHLPGHLRAGLQARFGDGGRGFTLPAHPSVQHDYWQWGATIDKGVGWDRVRLGVERGDPDYYGIAGIVFDSAGQRAVSRVSTASEGVGASADVIEIHYQTSPRGGMFDVHVDDAFTATVDTHADEVHVGRAVYQAPLGSHAVELRAREGAPVRLYGVVLERSGPGVVVDDVALTGARARFHDKWLEPVYTEHLRMRSPDLLILWYGGNEGNDLADPADRTAMEIRRALHKLRTAVPEASCLLIGPADKPISSDGRWVHRERTSAIGRAMRTIALGNGCAYFDTVRFMGGPLSMVRWVNADPPLARDDHIHFSALGYELLAENILSELLVNFDD
jgi:lysophospholipase L1-like esterase